MSELTCRFARLGSSGKFPNNIERDISNLLKLPVTPLWITIPAKDQETRSKVTTMKVPILLPHQLYHYLYASCLWFREVVFFFCLGSKSTICCNYQYPAMCGLIVCSCYSKNQGFWKVDHRQGCNRKILEICQSTKPSWISGQDQRCWYLRGRLQVQRCWGEIDCRSIQCGTVRSQKLHISNLDKRVVFS